MTDMECERVPDISKHGPSAADPAERAGAPEAMEITPEMIEAGVQVLWDSCAIEHPLQADRLVVERMYRAMGTVLR